MAYITITAPSIEPIDLTTVKSHLRVTDSNEDAIINLFIKSARESAEQRTGRALINRTLELALDEFPDAIELPVANASSIVSIKYLDDSGTEITISALNYFLDTYSITNWVLPAYGYTFPTTLGTANNVKVRFIAGYGATADLVPSNIITWMLLAIGSMYANRESVSEGQTYELPKSFCDGLLDSVRTWRK